MRPSFEKWRQIQTSCIDFARLPPPNRRLRRQSVRWFALLWILTAAVQSAPSRAEPAPAPMTLAQGSASPYCIHFSPSAPKSVKLAASLDTYGRLTAQALANSGSRGGYLRLQWKRPWFAHMHNVWVQLDERLPPWVVVSPPQALEVGAAN